MKGVAEDNSLMAEVVDDVDIEMGVISKKNRVFVANIYDEFIRVLNNVCHHITRMDLPPREMKETIFTRHYQTVLPLLANNRKDTLQALHTSVVNTAIDKMKNNRVLDNCSPPINDEETLLSRRQRITLSQLCSGHCKLLIHTKSD